MEKNVVLKTKTYNRLAAYATGFMTPDDVIWWLLDQHEGVSHEKENTTPVATSADGRDLTKYVFQGKTYSKARLVHAVIKQYAGDNPLINFDELESVFPPSLQAFSLPVILEWEKAQELYGSKTPKRFYLKDSMRIEIGNCSVAVCTQWGVENIHNFISRASSLNYTITPQGVKYGNKKVPDMERQCRICGEWKSIKEQYSYPSADKKHYWCKDCCDTYNDLRTKGQDPKEWIRSEQAKWDYVARQVAPDRPIIGLQSGTSKTTQVGYVNKNNQRNLGTTGEAGTDHNSISYKMQCLNCQEVYSSNGTDIFQRKCPHCQGGSPSSDSAVK